MKTQRHLHELLLLLASKHVVLLLLVRLAKELSLVRMLLHLFLDHHLLLLMGLNLRVRDTKFFLRS